MESKDTEKVRDEDKPVKEMEMDSLYDGMQYVPLSATHQIPQNEVDLQFDWTVPKSRQLSQTNEAQGFHEPLNQDIPTSFLSSTTEQILNEHLCLSNNSIEFSNGTGIILSNFQRFISRIVGAYANTSKGRDGKLLTIIKSNYTIQESRKNYEDAEDLKKRELELAEKQIDVDKKKGLF